MQRHELEKLDRELSYFVEELFEGMGRLERRRAMRWYVEGLLLDGDRKSIEPMAARLVKDPSEVQAMRQRLQEAVTRATWSDDELRKRLACKADADLPGAEALILDDTGFPKKGVHSVGVARQYSGTLGRTDNCQVATSLHLASERGSCCIGMRLYLGVEWINDLERRTKAGVPDDVQFQTKWQIGLDMIDSAACWGVRPHVIIADAGFGDITDFREALKERGRKYVVGVQSELKVWAPNTGPVAPENRVRKGAKGHPIRKFITGEQKPVTLSELAISRGQAMLQTLTWREGSRGPQKSRFGAVRIRTAHRHTTGRAPGEEEWLLYAWPAGSPKPTKYWLSSLPANTTIRRLVYLAKLRWRIERDYQEMKQELGLDHFEGRTWRGFHHHVTLVAIAHAFLALQRALSPPIPNERMDAPGGETGVATNPAMQDRPLPTLQSVCA
jgi:SRSO17 transposase